MYNAARSALPFSVRELQRTVYHAAATHLAARFKVLCHTLDIRNLLSSQDKEKSGIYIIRNTVNHKVYVGSAIRLIARYRVHLCDLKKGKHNQRLLNFVNKYGIESLSFEVLELVEVKEDLIEREQHWIDLFNSCKSKEGFNVCPVAGSSLGTKMPDSHKASSRKRMMGNKIMLGYKHTAEARLKCSIASKKRVWTEESSRKLSASKKGVPVWDTHPHPMTGKKGKDNPSFGRKISDEARLVFSEVKRGSKNPMFGKFKSVTQTDETGRIIKVYPSTGAVKESGFSPANVSKAVNGKSDGVVKNRYKGYLWIYTVRD